MFIFEASEYQKFKKALAQAGVQDQFKERCEPDPLINAGINCQASTKSDGKKQVAVAVTYKIALEIGSLGDNVQYLRRQMEALATTFNIFAGRSQKTLFFRFWQRFPHHLKRYQPTPVGRRWAPSQRQTVIRSTITPSAMKRQNAGSSIPV
jgi:hypothetical protein